MKPHPAKAILESQGRTQRQLAAEVGIGYGVLGRCLNGRQHPWPAMRRKVAAALGVTEPEAWRLDDDDVAC